MPEESAAGSSDKSEPGYFVVAVETERGLRLEICESTISVVLAEDKFGDLIAKIRRYMAENGVPASRLPPGMWVAIRSGLPPPPPPPIKEQIHQPGSTGQPQTGVGKPPVDPGGV